MISSTAALDGQVESTGLAFAGGAARTGDTDYFDLALMMNVPRGVRGFWSFDLGAVPAGATVLSATLTAAQTQVPQGDPYTNHGVVTLDHLDYGATLDGADYAVAALTSAFATLSSDATLGVKGPVDVTARVQADLTAARTRSQYRLRFSTLDSDDDGILDYADFTTAESATNAPVLTVTYQP